MKVNIVNYEMAFTNGILSKFAWRMSEELDRLGVKNVVTDAPDPRCEVNHHIIYVSYRHAPGVINTVMVTHLNTEQKYQKLAEVMREADRGVCMSRQMVDELVGRGFPEAKLSYVVPAHDGRMIPIPVAILTNVYPDGVKREQMLSELAKQIDPSRFIFKIMGKNWDTASLERAGLRFEYHPEFDQDVQDGILATSKYYLYFGLDQGSMALLDAMNAGVKTIAPLDGFHRHSGVDYPFETQEELNKIFFELQRPPLDDWTWERYATEHLKIWKELSKA